MSTQQQGSTIPDIRHVFVLMLENHSFDNIFAFSKIPGITCATTKNSNSYTYPLLYKGPGTYYVKSPAPTSMPSDPGHEFLDVVEQLCGLGTKFESGKPYPTIDNSGFVANYATSTTEAVTFGPPGPPGTEVGEIMACFDTENQLPVMYQLATNFVICDHWFSSLPGPTWPNRFFVHGASSGGWADSPGGGGIAEWEFLPDGFEYPCGASIFDRLTEKGIPWRIYHDDTVGTVDSALLGWVSQVAALKHISLFDVHGVSTLTGDLNGTYPYAYTFIEPNYGDVILNSYSGGSSQHPMDGVAAGEALVKLVYEAIRNSPLWESSLLIITYDEHGGFYDCVAPPAALPPDDGDPRNTPQNASGFLFDRYGVRVPAVVVSPLVDRGVVDQTVYDHSSVPATLERQFGVAPMTQRDTKANDVLHLLHPGSPRTDCPTRLQPAPDVERAVELVVAAVEEAVVKASENLPERGNVNGFLQILAKSETELAAGNQTKQANAAARYQSLTTRADASQYATDMRSKVEAAKAVRATIS